MQREQLKAYTMQDTLYCWEIKSDLSVDKPKDMNNHGWDAVRYAIEDLYLDVKNVGVSKRR